MPSFTFLKQWENSQKKYWGVMRGQSRSTLKIIFNFCKKEKEKSSEVGQME
jgi:hypothetical protein